MYASARATTSDLFSRRPQHQSPPTPTPQRKDVAEIESLVDRGMNIDLVDATGASSLHRAVETADSSVVEALALFVTDINKTTPQGQTALHVAAQLDLADIAQLLVECNCDPGIEDNAGFTALDRAGDAGFAATSKALASAARTARPISTVSHGIKFAPAAASGGDDDELGGGYLDLDKKGNTVNRKELSGGYLDVDGKELKGGYFDVGGGGGLSSDSEDEVLGGYLDMNFDPVPGAEEETRRPVSRVSTVSDDASRHSVHSVTSVTSDVSEHELSGFGAPIVNQINQIQQSMSSDTAHNSDSDEEKQVSRSPWCTAPAWTHAARPPRLLRRRSTHRPPAAGHRTRPHPPACTPRSNRLMCGLRLLGVRARRREAAGIAAGLG